MRTVREITAITGISVRALHYYDEIGLFQPTSKSEADTGFMAIRAVEETLYGCCFFGGYVEEICEGSGMVWWKGSISSQCQKSNQQRSGRKLFTLLINHGKKYYKQSRKGKTI